MCSYLQVAWQCQLRSVQLTLVNASALPYTLHPQAFHIGGGCDDVGAHIGCVAPVGEQSCNNSSYKPQQPQEEAKELNRRAGHDSLTGRDGQTAKYKVTLLSHCWWARRRHLRAIGCLKMHISPSKTHFKSTGSTDNISKKGQRTHWNIMLPHKKERLSEQNFSSAGWRGGSCYSSCYLRVHSSTVNSTELTSSHRVCAIPPVSPKCGQK